METRSRKAQRCNPWLTIPAEVMAKVFAYLAKNDQLNAGATCHHWRDVSLIPRFFEERHFHVTGQSDKEVQDVTHYIDTFGCYLKRLTISVQKRVPSYPNYEYDHSVGILYQTKILEALYQMIERLKDLSVLNFDNVFLTGKDCCRVLHGLAASKSAATLTKLTLRNFYWARWPCPSIKSVLLEVIAKFKNLKRVGLDQGYLDNTFLTQLISATPLMKEVVIYVKSRKIGNPPPIPDWQEAVTKRPDLLVWVDICLKFDGLFDRYDYEDILSPDMPLVSVKLQITFHEYTASYRVENYIESNINAISACISHPGLKVFILEWKGGFRGEDTLSNYPEALVTLVKACPSLKHLSVQRTVSMKTILQVAEAAAHPRGKKEVAGGGAGGGPSSTTHSLQMHVTGCNTALGTVMKRVSRVNPSLQVHVCDGCQQWLDNLSFI